MSTWLLPRLDLTPDQLRAVEMDPTLPRLVLGPPGSGKTQVLLHRAAYLRDRYKVPPTKFKIFIYGNVLKEYIRSGIKFLELPEDSVCTFHSWCADFYRKRISRKLPWSSKANTPDFDEIIKAVTKAITLHPEWRHSLDFALVDEGQDLPPECFQILQFVARHITIYADRLQQIYERGSDESNIMKSLNISRPNISFLGAYRNAEPVARLASYFIPEQDRKAEYLSQVRSNQNIRERPLLFVAKSADEEMDRLADITKQRQVMNQRVAIIVPQNKLVHGLAKGLMERGVEVEKAVPRRKFRKEESGVTFDNLVPKIAVFHSIKGLTFDCVLLPRLVEYAYFRFKGDLRKRMLFVGIARATQWVYLSTLEEQEVNELTILKEAEANQHLIIQYGRGKPSPQLSLFEQNEEDDAPDDDFPVL